MSGFARTGAVTFTFYTNLSCTDGSAVATAPSLDAGNSDPRSVDSSALATGNYAYQATVADDANYLGGTTPASRSTVGPGADSTAVSAGPPGRRDTSCPDQLARWPLGSALHDTGHGHRGSRDRVHPERRPAVRVLHHRRPAPAAPRSPGPGPDTGGDATRGTATARLVQGTARRRGTTRSRPTTWPTTPTTTGGTSGVRAVRRLDQGPTRRRSAQVRNWPTTRRAQTNSARGRSARPCTTPATVTGGLVTGFTPSGGLRFVFFTDRRPAPGGPDRAPGPDRMDASGGRRHPARRSKADSSALGGGHYSLQGRLRGRRRQLHRRHLGVRAVRRLDQGPARRRSAQVHLDAATRRAQTNSRGGRSARPCTTPATVTGGLVTGFTPSGGLRFVFFTTGDLHRRLRGDQHRPGHRRRRHPVTVGRLGRARRRPLLLQGDRGRQRQLHRRQLRL